MDRGSPRWVAAGLCLPRLAAPRADLGSAALPWLQAALGELGALPPPGFVMDAALMLGGAALDTSRAHPVDAPGLRTALGRYEDRVLGRLAADRHLQAARDAFAALPDAARAAAIGIVVAAIAGRASLMPVQPAILRRLARRPAEEVLSLGFEAWREEPEVLDALAAGYDALTDVSRTTPSLLSDADVFVLEHLEVLREMGQRVAISQIVNAAEALARSWPRRIKVKRREDGPSPMSLEDESAYPAGGFTAVSTLGTLENLVTSELVYMTAPDQRRNDAEIDLFEVRYAEGELLYYTRDEALIVRPRRLTAFVLMPNLENARIKDADVPWQRIVVMIGWMLASIRSLERWLGETDLRFLCIIEDDEVRLGALKYERALVDLLLSEWRDKGSAEVLFAPRASWRERLAEEARRSDVRVTVLDSDPFGDPAPPGVTLQSLAASGRSWDAWCKDGLEVLRVLV